MNGNNDKNDAFEEYLNEATSQDEQEKTEPSKEEINFDEWSVADMRQVKESLAILRDEMIKEIKIPINKEKKLYIVLYVKELPVKEQLLLIEKFYQFDKKTGAAKMDFEAYYRNVYIATVTDSLPKGLKWSEVKHYGKKFLRILLEHFPSPFDIQETSNEETDKLKN